VIVVERVADAISEIARPNRDDQAEKPQIQADPAHRRPRLLRNTPPAEFDWDNAPTGSPQGVPRCITPRPWPPNLVTAEA